MLTVLAYLFTLLMAYTIIPLFALLVRILSILSLSKMYWSISRDKSPVNVAKFSIKLAQPVGFATAILHGYLAVQMGAVFVRGMIGRSADDLLFMPIFLGVCFLYFGIKRLKNPANVKVENKIELKDGQQTLILNPDETTEEEEDPMKILNKKLQSQFKENAQEFIQGNTIIGLMGKLTGVAIAAMSMNLF